jgi:outer membrane lipoprotein-sorting protein
VDPIGRGCVRPCIATFRADRYRMRSIQLIPAVIALSMLGAAPGHSQTRSTAPPAPIATSPGATSPGAAGTSQAADLAKVEAYLNGLTTAQADFVFAGPDGAVTHGVFSLSRPSRLRFEYTEPKGNLLIADGDYVIYWDAQQKEASNLPIGSTPLDFLLRPKISLTEGVKVTAFEHNAGVIRATLTRTKNDGEGSVTVAFSDQPLELRGWRLLDGQGQITDVTFANWKFGMPLDAALFHFDPPNKGRRGR